MATLRQYFDTDFARVMGVHGTWNTQGSATNASVIVRLHFDFDANAKFASCYVPACSNPTNLCRALINQAKDLLKLDSGVQVQASQVYLDEVTDSRELHFTGRVFVYTETDIPTEESQDLAKHATSQGLTIRIRGSKFASARAKLEQPLAFISHDSRDKDAVARPIAVELSKLLCPVWFDEFSLKVGDSLRESIEKGLKESKKCILVLTPQFLSNPGWTKVEFNSIFSREILEKRSLILPVWYGVNKEEIFNYCPSLIDRLGVDWNLGEVEVAKRLYRAIIASDS